MNKSPAFTFLTSVASTDSKQSPSQFFPTLSQVPAWAGVVCSIREDLLSACLPSSLFTILISVTAQWVFEEGSRKKLCGFKDQVAEETFVKPIRKIFFCPFQQPTICEMLREDQYLWSECQQRARFPGYWFASNFTTTCQLVPGYFFGGGVIILNTSKPVLQS